MAVLKFKKKFLLIKMQAVEGTAEVPTGAANAIQTSSLDITPLEGTWLDRDIDKGALGNSLQLLVGTHVKCSFEVEMVGSGTVGVKPNYSPCLRMSAMNVVETATTNVIISPVSSNEEIATIYIHLDGQLHPLTDCKSNWSMTVSPLGIAKYKFDVIGLWADPTSVVDPTPDTSASKVPLAASAKNTPILTLGGVGYKTRDFSYDHGNDVKYNNVINQEFISIDDRSPKGSITIDQPPLATKNWYTSIKALETAAIVLQHDTRAGKITTFNWQECQLINPTRVDNSGRAGIKMDFVPLPTSAGDDEVIITLT